MFCDRRIEHGQHHVVTYEKARWSLALWLELCT